jgi:hypothetical protein
MLDGVIPAAALFTYTHFNRMTRIQSFTDKAALMGAWLVCIIVFCFYSFIYMQGVTISSWLDGEFYYIEIFAPISMLMLWDSIRSVRSYAARTVFFLMFGVAVLSCGIRVTKNMLITAIDLTRSDTVSFAEMHDRINRLIGSAPLAVDALFVPTIDGEPRLLLVGTFDTVAFLDNNLSETWGEERVRSEACTIVIRQSNTGLEAPPYIAGFVLGETTFSSPTRLFGITFYRTSKGYNYAVYHRANTFQASCNQPPDF